MCIVDIIKQLANAHGISITTLEQTVGLGNGTIGKWRKQSPSCDKLKLVADYLSVSIDYLLTGQEKLLPLPDDEQELLTYYKKLPEREQVKLIVRAETLAEVYADQLQRKKIIQTTVNLKVYDIAAGAGTSIPFSEDDRYTIKTFLQTDVPSNATCGIYINGNSMEPKYPNGSLIWVKETQDVQFGDVIIAILNGEPFCKIFQSDGLYSINKEYKPIPVTENDTFFVFGRVLGYYVE